MIAIGVVAIGGCDPEGFRYRDTGFAVDLPECFRDFECDDGVSCTADQCVGLRCVSRRPHSLCPHGVCRLASQQSCVARGSMACVEDEDCADSDPCTTDERCEDGFCALEYVGDADSDSDLAPACGGGDCDDRDPLVSVYAAERCDRRDEDCDGEVDEHSCGMGICGDDGCECAQGSTLCDDGRCRDLAHDPFHCGGCAIRCPSGVNCTDGVCD